MSSPGYDPADESPLGAALAYARLFAWRVAPNAGKVPIIVNWTVDGTTDAEQIIQWWDALYPEAGVSIVCGEASGLFVIDVDVHGEISGFHSLADLEATYGPLPATPRVRTGGDGEHIYFAWPTGVTIRNDAGRKLGPGLDVRAEGGQVVAPPSIHASGNRYRWLSVPAPPSIFGPLNGVELAAPPQWLVELLTATPAPITRPAPQPATSGLPGAQWAASVTWPELLQASGAMLLGERHQYGTDNRYQLWCRPGVTDHAGATLGYGGSDVLKVFTTNWLGLQAERTYTRFGFLAATRYNGDHARCAAELRERGFGDVVDLDALVPKPESAPKPATPVPGAITLGELMAGDDEAYDWLVPGLLERGDRVVITGDEGWGKSTLLRQLGIGATAGHNPFARSILDTVHGPLRVLLVDCENSTRQLRREFPKVLRAVNDLDAVNDRFWLSVRTEGLILDSPRDPMGDRAWLEEQLKAIRPDVLLIGPLYKLMSGDPNAEQESRLLALYLDRIRGADAGMAVIIEAHAPHGQKRPYGWSGWKRWPEFGLHLSDDGSLTPFRGGRDEERHWPRHLRRGSDADMPWVPTSQPIEATPVDRAANAEVETREAVVRLLGGNRLAWLSVREIAERLGRKIMRVLQAVRVLQDDGWLLVDRGERARPNGTTEVVEIFTLDPNGPAGPPP